MPGFLPDTDAGLLAWSSNFSTLITATPTAYGLTAGNATDYATAQTAYASALTAATEPSTRGNATVLAKDIARDELIALTRLFARQVGNTMSVTDLQRQALGLTIRDPEPSPIPPPADWPGVQVRKVVGRTVSLRLINTENPTRRAKPPGVIGASIFTFVGTTPPTEITDWVFEGNTGKTLVDVTFPSTVPAGATVFITCFWFNGRKESGPACPPVSTNLQGGTVSVPMAA